MAYLLSRGRFMVAAHTPNPLAAVSAWLAKRRAQRLQRLALAALLELDVALLDDLGIDRLDLLDAMRTDAETGGAFLATRRAQRSENWRPRR